VADPRKTAPRAPAPAAESDPGERLAELNDHLGRFLVHADQLVDEWSRFGAQVRASVDGELGRVDRAIDGAIDQAVSRAAERAGRELAGTLEAQVAARVDRSLGEGVTRLRGELDRMARTAHAIGTGAPPRADVGRLTLIAVVVGNLLLAGVLGLGVHQCATAAPGAAPAAIASDAGVSAAEGSAPVVPALDPAADPAIARACAALVAGWSDEAAAVVARAGTAACGAGADAVLERLSERWAPPPVDAGVAPPDAAAAPKKPRRAKAK
jgi:hypothetical protein